MAKTNKTRVKEHMREHGFSGTVERCIIDKDTGLANIEIEMSVNEFNLKFLNGLAAIFHTDDLEISGGIYCDCCGGSSHLHINKATLPSTLNLGTNLK